MCLTFQPTHVWAYHHSSKVIMVHRRECWKPHSCKPFPWVECTTKQSLQSSRSSTQQGMCNNIYRFKYSHSQSWWLRVWTLRTKAQLSARGYISNNASSITDFIDWCWNSVSAQFYLSVSWWTRWTPLITLSDLFIGDFFKSDVWNYFIIFRIVVGEHKY